MKKYNKPKTYIHNLSVETNILATSGQCGCTCGCASSDINPHCKHTGVGSGCVGCPYCTTETRSPINTFTEDE